MRVTRLLVPALVAVAVLAVTTATLLAVRSPAERPGHRGETSPYSVTVRAVRRLLAAAPAPRDAHPADDPPALRKAATTVASPNFVDRSRSWTAPGSTSAALAYLRAHLPAGLTADGRGSEYGPDRPTVYTIQGDATGDRWRRPLVYTGLQLEFSVVRHGHGIAVRVDAQAVWLPPRSAAEHVPANARAVTVVVRRTGGTPTVRRTLGASKARSLAALVDRLPVSEPGTVNCPMDRGFTDTLTFGAVRVTAQVGGCEYVTVTSHGTRQPTLDGGGRIDRAVTSALGLPRDYGN
jgi:hypothetical protein